MSFDEIVYNTAIADGLPRPLALLVVAQSKHESNGYTSSLFLDCNNSFGFGYTSSKCKGHNYRGYNSIVDSTNDVVQWIYNNFSDNEIATTTTPEQYAQLLRDNGYYTDSVSNYAAGLRRWFLDNIGTATFSGIGLILLGVAAFVIYKKRKKRAK